MSLVTPTVPAASAPEVAVSQPTQVSPGHLNQAAPSTEPAPEFTNPLLDRSEYSEEDLTGTHLEPTQSDEPEESTEELDDTVEPAATLADMVGSELMQDPGSSLVARGLERLCKGKVDHNRAFGQAIAHDDARFIDVAYLKEVLGDDAEEAKQAAEFLLNYADTYAANLQTKLYSSVEGGEEAVRVAARHFNDTATPAEKALVTQMLDSGNFEYMQHAIKLMTERTKGVMPQHRPQTFGTPTGLQPISRDEFGKAVIENPNMSQGDYEKLRQRLAAGFRK